ncbi:MAG: cytidylate kinase [Syntrophorhabdaceae bacterium PtaU1.Bin034]|jgi:cytidylate kinase|nr:MAG: cytidylate kinase [Syntrophorhabdaceae bacterium PtaU1.Bin034]
MYLVTFTRKMGTSGSEIAMMVAGQLQYKLYDTEAIENTAREMGFLNDVKVVDEKAPSLFERLFSHRPEIYLDRLNSVIYELASRGNAVFLGRGSHVLLRTLKCALHVRVTASMEKRLRNLMKRGFQKEEAMRALRKSDHERAAFIKFAFGVDWDDPEQYDVVFNMDNLTVDLAVDTVVQMARAEEIKARSIDAMISLEMMGLTKRVEAALIEAGFSLTSLSVSVAEPGRIELGGSVDVQSDKDKAEKVIRQVKGVKFVHNQIQAGRVREGFARGV